jgi:hypothetical protein
MASRRQVRPHDIANEIAAGPRRGFCQAHEAYLPNPRARAKAAPSRSPSLSLRLLLSVC